MDPRFLHTARPSTGDRTPPARPRRRMPVGPVPASGAWRQGDPVGRRHFAELGPLHLEAGGRLPEVRLAYETWGTLNARDRKSTRLNSSHVAISYAVFCLQKKIISQRHLPEQEPIPASRARNSP